MNPKPNNGMPLSDIALSSDATRLSDVTIVSDATIVSDTTMVSHAAQLSDATLLSSTRQSTAIPPPAMSIAAFQRRFADICDTIGTVVVGKPLPIKRCVTTLIAGGHILIEDDPGTGKTQLARGLANAIATSFKRIQFTPDLLPSDVIGATIWNQHASGFEFRPGPIFASIVLADEINRASAKTQSALLEVMEERTVTVDGITHAVPQPFMVLATQNPVEQLGTYRLPEAQMDRFVMTTGIGHPSHDNAIDILTDLDCMDRAQTVRPVIDVDELLLMRQAMRDVYIDDAIRDYIVRLTEATRHHQHIAAGASMRGALAMARCARIWAASDARSYVLPDDIKELAPAVFTHRIRLSAEAKFNDINTGELLDEILDTVPVPLSGHAQRSSR
ncbi:ATPase AAA [Bifidobacterium sp. DSM 109957]|uniref:ATPase AAA n=1 Tax=Bifidobacterium oedipodis TaxID=2675322 RepID=A0A7Y0ER33_9BIFI|nr:MoxR family ATPase [Bifidobacterium sp. DSM 109957]NMM93776.1 ATPase AAA [Bifidobacterium sp. DSM 109957]